MSFDLHDALTSMAADGGDPREAPVARMLTRVHRRRAARAAAVSAASVTTVGAMALGVASWLPTSSVGPVAQTEAPATDPSADALPDVDADLATAVVPVWDQLPDSALDVTTAPERAVTRALAALWVSSLTEDRQTLFLLDAADSTWVRSLWPESSLGVSFRSGSLSADGGTLEGLIVGGARPRVQLVELGTGTVTEVGPLLLDGVECWAGPSSFSPDGSTLTILATADPEAGPVVVFELDLATREVRTLATFEGQNLASQATIDHSPDGSLLAVSTSAVGEPYGETTTVLDAAGTVVRQWGAALQADPWYGNDGLRASGLVATDEGEWKGYLWVGSGESVGEVRPYSESPWVYGTPTDPPEGTASGEFLRAAGEPSGVVRIEDATTGAARTWLRVTTPEWSVDGTLMLPGR